MSGEIDLNKMLETLSPALDPVSYVYVSCPPEGADLSDDLVAFATIREAEGLTLILPVEVASKAGFDTASPQRRITLQVHSSLESVGLTAAVSAALATGGVPANMIAGYYHDHILVPANLADLAMEILTGIASSS
ncbi:ACT domain-containing protein [Roseibium sp. CAU 1637]|uniref:ACT domain-containing protein n=1 Tax=Roseibium limicola TaxID=2816037 RepID=A0A939EL91_9HYPH|nr:ACT domain-containing protein [Roseibium limicola]